ncbi:uncharacterized protein L201_003073 [Kwoniella dendrophila CBS 6074]|uniref:Protein FRA10AC1 n=1 Tax=Kwoniella dendrophila CBS 6074 TaxID=1295534 RepID=A0AAX4JUI6_9TREE
MSWKTSGGQLISGPPSSSLPSSSTSTTTTDLPLVKRLKPNSYGGGSVFQRESNFTSHYGYDKDALSNLEKSKKSDWDIVKENHRFIREDEEPKDVTWEERVARAYESKLFKEFALIDLKHYKSKQFALRWRTAIEVINGLGENTCGSLRCKYHNPSSTVSSAAESEFHASDLRFKDPDQAFSSFSSSIRRNEGFNAGKEEEEEESIIPELKSFELPFVYLENNQRKQALVKVRLCPKCQAKLTWKPKDEKEQSVKDDKRSRDRDRRKSYEDKDRYADTHDKDKRGKDDRVRERDRRSKDKDKDKDESPRRWNRDREKDRNRNREISSSSDKDSASQRYAPKKGRGDRSGEQRHRSRSRSPPYRNEKNRHYD